MGLSGEGRREKSGLFFCSPRVARGEFFWGIKKVVLDAPYDGAGGLLRIIPSRSL